jgi:hypothetical protein
MNKDVRIRGYFSKPKGVWGQKRLGNTAQEPDRQQHDRPVDSVIAQE